jgi:hypothetical protein
MKRYLNGARLEEIKSRSCLTDSVMLSSFITYGINYDREY